VWEYFLANKYTSSDGKKMWLATSGSQPQWTGWNTHAPWRYGFQYMPVYFSTGQVARYEAEAAARSGGVTVQNSYTSFSGSGYATEVLGASDKITFNLTQNVSGTGWHIVKIRYANPSQNANTMSVYVNGSKAKTVRLAENNNDNDPNHDWTNRSDI